MRRGVNERLHVALKGETVATFAVECNHAAAGDRGRNRITRRGCSAGDRTSVSGGGAAIDGSNHVFFFHLHGTCPTIVDFLRRCSSRVVAKGIGRGVRDPVAAALDHHAGAVH